MGSQIEIAPKLQENISKQIDKFFDASMRRMKLSPDQIDGQNLEQLRRSLGMVEDALARANSFGFCRIMVTATMSVVVKTSSDAHFEIGITPLLLESKARIMDRLEDLGVVSPEAERDILRQQVAAYRARWQISFGGVIWAIGVLFIWLVPNWASWTSFTLHNNYISLMVLISIALGGTLWAIIDDNSTRRWFALGSIAIAAIVAAVSLVGG